ncbi:LysM peptidoglycan-binding domain-containing protein [Mesobacterium pallidum]|uniref:LysM peptidoglycan-binding domain-containing protein n=1 Tax=Mesobacterium pallidum TaxID=2872037 RepID=UPI001EE1D4FE|nr:LysM peptidoglycan-binding domain-containing protein [Mesobacterium pallidum]
MIRIILASTAAVALIAGLYYVQPSAETDTVTRAQTDLTALPAPAPQPAVVETPAPQPAVTEAVAHAVVPAPRPAPAPVTTVATDDTDLQAMSLGVLAELGLKPQDAPKVEDAAMQHMTSDILSNIRSATGAPAPASAGASALQSLVSKALAEGRTDSYIDQLVNEAAGRGDVSVPKALVTNEGRVDTSTLLASIVAQARVAAGEEIAPPEVAGGRGVEVRLQQGIGSEMQQRQFYTVSSGDSLGAIAVKFYGDASRFTAIYEANRRILSSPDQIRAGQRLVIPTI